MFINYADAPSDLPEGYASATTELLINSCGTYRLHTRNSLPTCRPKGRADYQLIYIAEGRGYFYQEDGGCVEVAAGNMVLYRPDEYQHYIYYSKDRPDIYWIHFTGTGVENIFSQCRIFSTKQAVSFVSNHCRPKILPSNNTARQESAADHAHCRCAIIPCGTHPRYARYFNKIILELQLQKDLYEKSAALLFVQLLVAVGRFNCELAHPRMALPSEEVELLTTYFHEHYQEPINIEAYIKSRNVSISSFFRLFKQYTDLSPLQYLLEIRLTNAKMLLESTDYNIGEIAALVGYENALYFSRLFHRHTGYSPREYRDLTQQTQE